MNTLLNNGAPLIDKPAVDLSISWYIGNPAMIDLGDKILDGGIIIIARTSNTQGTPTAIKVRYAFCHEALQVNDNLPGQLNTRSGALVCTLATGTGQGPTRDHASPRQPIGGRYLAVWWETDGGQGGDQTDLKVWAQLVA